MTQRLDRALIALFDRFTHGEMGRRAFFTRLVALVGSVAGAQAALAALSNDYARAALVEPDDRRLTIERPSYDSPLGRITGLLARGTGVAKRPTVLVVHENRGLNPHIEDVTRRLAVSGFLAFAPDLLSPLGGAPADDEDKARAMIAGLDAEKTVAALVDAVGFLAGHPESNGSVGAVGFCWGGGFVNRLAVASSKLKAAVSYYGPTLDAEQAARVNAPLLLHYAGLDDRITSGAPAFEAALKAAGKEYELYIYEGADHAFNNDTNRKRYDPKAAALAWDRTIAFLEGHLGAAVPPLL